MRFLGALGLVAVVAVVAVVVGGGCSLIVSTSDLTGGGPLTSPEGGMPDATTSSSSSSGSGSIDSGLGDAGETTDELPGLIGAWLFEDGTARDSSGQTHDGALIGDAAIIATDRGKSVQVSGHGNLTVASLFNDAFPHTGTISVWFKYTEMDPTDEQGIFDEWDDTRSHCFVRHANGDKLGSMQIVWQTPAADHDYRFSSGFDLAQGVWAHVVMTWDEPNARAQAFLNGAKVDAGPYVAPFVPTNQWMNFGVRLHGFIDDVRLYDRVLSDVQIASLP